MVEVLGPLTGAQPELPAVAAGHDRHERGGAVVVADLLGPVVDGERLGAVHVDDQPLLLEAEVLHGRAHRRAGAAVRPVGAEHVVGPHLPHRAGTGARDRVGGAVADPHRAGPAGHLGDLGHVDAAAQLDGRVSVQRGAQHPLQLGLVEHVGLRVAVLRWRPG